MATGSRTLKLSILGDVDQLNKSLKAANTDVNNSANTISDFGKKAALAFAVAGAAAVAFAASAVKAAVEDEAAQAKLAETIKATTSATAAQIVGVEDYITKTSIAIGVTDDELRPAFARLTRSTKDVEDAQKLLNLALDISSATGKPLEAVANALGKAYDGNLASLGRLGLGIDQSILKSKDFDLVFNTLTKTFGGFADNEAQSAEKAFARIKIATDEVQEQIGAALLPVVQELTTFILTDVVPVVQSFVDGLTGQDGLTDSLTESQTKAVEFGKKVRGIIGTIIDLKDELIVVGALIGTIFITSKIAAAVQGTIVLITSLIKAYNLLKASALVAGIASAFALNPLLGVGAVALAAAVLAAANALVGNDEESPTFAVGGAPGAISGRGGSSGGGSGGGDGPTAAEILAKAKADAAAKSAAAKGSTDAAKAAAAKAAAEAAKAAAIAAKAAAEAEANIVGGAFDSGLSGTQSLAAIEAISNRPFAFGTSGVNTNTLTGILAASNQPVVINVNGPSIIDEEGFSRAINEAQNNSYFRGTGGAANLVGIG